MMFADDESLQETLHLLSQPNFKQRFTQSVAEADKGKVVSFEDVFGEPLGDGGVIENKTPQGWADALLDELVVKISNGANTAQFDEFIGFPISRIETIWNGEVDPERVKYIKENDESFVEKYKLQEGDILFSHINSDNHIGKTAIYKKNPKVLIHGINLLLIRFSDNLCADFFNYQFKFLKNKGAFSAVAQRAVNQSSINQQKLKSFTFLVPPLNEQRRIVAKIEALFSELDNGIAALKTAREQLKVYRQAVLKHAFEGKLTAQWRKDNADKLETPEQLLARIQTERETRYQQQLAAWNEAVEVWETNGKEGKKPGKPKEPEIIEILTKSEAQELFELPAGWGFMNLGSFIERIDAGKSFKCDEREPSQSEIGVAKVSAVTWGEYDESESKTCIDSEKINPNYFINSKDFILSRANTIELVGACVIAKKVTKKIMLSDKTLRIKFSSIDERYVLQYLRSHFGRNEIMERSTGNQDSMRNIGQDRIKSIVIPMCSECEMENIIQLIDKNLELTSVLSNEIEMQIAKSETLRQSILKKAFSGQLVAQDPNDEPASELMARIQAEKAEKSGKGTKR